MASSFIEKLRMDNIFGGGGINMPNMAPTENIDYNHLMNVSLQEREKDRNLQRELARMRSQPARLNQIAQNMQQPTQPMNVVFQDTMTPFQRESLAIRRRDVEQKGDIATQRAGLTQQDVDTRRRRAELAEKIADGRATDEEKQEYQLAQIRARGEITGQQIDQRGNIVSRQIGERGNITSRQIGERGVVQERLQKSGQEGALARIAATAAETRNTNAAKPVKGDTPSQTRTDQNNRARELMMKNPELGSLITIGDNGQIQISPDADEVSRNMINSAIFGKDVQLPKETPKTTPVKSSKYKVTVR